MANKKNNNKNIYSIKKIAVLTSGGDSPGMNCAIRAVVRTAINENIKIFGIQKGYSGLIDNEIHPLNISSVGNIIQHGGTILQTSRSLEFMTKKGRKLAYENLLKHQIDGLIVIGGDGSYNGAYTLHKEFNFPVIGIPGTIDNDMSGTDYTIGFDTAVMNATVAVDKIRDTANSHARTFIVEVMGRKSPAIALSVGICTGAENVVLPTNSVEEIDIKKIATDIKRGIKRGKTSSIIIAAEGEKAGVSYAIQERLRNLYKIDAHVCILGHIQRGGSPTPTDRFIASEMGNLAVKALLNGHNCSATVLLSGKVKLCDLDLCLSKKTSYQSDTVSLLSTLSI